MQLYALVLNNEIQRINVQLPAVVDSVSIPAGASDLEQFNLYPIQGSELQYNPKLQRMQGPRYEFDGAAVQRIYTVEDIPLEELAAIAMQEAKDARQAEVQALTVATASGRTFDGNEDAQNRMSRACTALNPQEETLWVLADNTPAMISREELQEALRLAGAAQTAIWVKPYEVQ